MRMVGTDGLSTIKLSHPPLMCLLFPYLFVNDEGHYYSLVPKTAEPVIVNNEVISENR